MGSIISRHKLAKATAAAIADGDTKGVQRLAAYLVDERRTGEAELVVRDIEKALTDRGIVVADVTSARKLSSEAAQSITSFIKSKTSAEVVHLREHIDESVIAGVRLSYGDKLLDATVTAKLERLT